MLRAIMAMKMPIEVVANRRKAAPVKSSGSEPSIGTPSTMLSPMNDNDSKQPKHWP